ncbi:cyclic nucleotide-binding domain-containing protein [Microbaculum marinisediminis]|uniref:Cyclic nucleotide-binding domain-containing protein n=1 Tax=Microbaculum marinisediminis TaxID=2931392 RepID=A0AAW5R2G5_9HYPH|nr:cyclic nucleotide-binding domain-containing protein [Microbaculum sp. A6E488]MCT8973304.1 cyclic nucleotide-binding domain-containing protein [Microbaculum sp. A6E488]
MSINSEVETLRTIPIFRTIEPGKLRLLAFISERITFRPGETICTQGEPGDSAFIILSGNGEVLVDIGGEMRRVAEIKQNDVVGEMALLTDMPRTATVVADSEIAALRISKENFFRILQEFPEVSMEMMRVLARRLERTTHDLAVVRGQLAEAGAG